MRISKKRKKTNIFVAGLLVFLSIIALIISFFSAKNLQNKMAENQLKMLTEKTELGTKTFFKELNTSLNTIAGLAVSGVFKETEIGNWSAGMLPVLQSNLNITAISVTNNLGLEYVVSLSDSLLSYYVIKAEDESKASCYTRNLTTDSIQTIDKIVTVRAIDQASYKDHVSNHSDTIVWYVFQAIPGIKKQAGYAASVKPRTKLENEELVVSIYVSLEKLDDFMKETANSVHADLFMYTADGKFFDFENEIVDTLNSDLSDFLVGMDKVKNPLFKKAMQVAAGVEVGDSMKFQSFNFDNREYWGAFRAARRGNNNLRIGLIVHESDFFMILKGKLGFLFFSALIVLLFSAIFLAFTLRKYLLIEPSQESVEKGDILKMIEKGENDFTEFKSTIRMNLFAKKPGKEIELAWLKSVVAFCNTNGGTILIGVNDDGEILGLEADVFQNDDKCLLHVQSLLKDHVGMEFTKYINYKLHTSGDKKILAVHCTPSPEPLFLINNSKEQFYVRSGPASIELPTSKALKYIKDRKID